MGIAWNGMAPFHSDGGFLRSVSAWNGTRSFLENEYSHKIRNTPVRPIRPDEVERLALSANPSLSPRITSLSRVSLSTPDSAHLQGQRRRRPPPCSPPSHLPAWRRRPPPCSPPSLSCRGGIQARPGRHGQAARTVRRPPWLGAAAAASAGPGAARPAAASASSGDGGHDRARRSTTSRDLTFFFSDLAFFLSDLLIELLIPN